MSEHPRVTYQDGKETISVDSSRVIFLLVSDVGAEGVNAAVLRYRSRSDVVPVSSSSGRLVIGAVIQVPYSEPGGSNLRGRF